MEKIRTDISTFFVLGFTLSLMISGVSAYITINFLSLIIQDAIQQDTYVLIIMCVYWILIQLYFRLYYISFDENYIYIPNSLFDVRKQRIEVDTLVSMILDTGLAKGEKKSFYTLWLIGIESKKQINIKLFSKRCLRKMVSEVEKRNSSVIINDKFQSLIKN